MSQQKTSPKPNPPPKATSLVTHHSSLITLIIYTLLTPILTYPLILNLAVTVPNDIGDPLLNSWILAWDAHALLTDPLNLFNANIFHPLPNTLAYSEHLISTALLALPLQLFSAEPIVAYNLSLMVTFPLAGFGMYLLAFHWTRCRDAAFIAGLIFAFAPYRFAAIAHLQLLTFQWLPYALLFLDLSLTRPTKKGTLTALTIFLLLQFLASWYLAIYSALILGLYLISNLIFYRPPQSPNLPISQSPNLPASSFLHLLLPFIAAILLTLPFVLPYLHLIDQLQIARPLSLALSLAATPTDFLAAAPFNIFFGPLTESFRTRPHFTEENTLFPGLIALLLAAIGLFHLVKSSKQSPRALPILLTLSLSLVLSLFLTFAAPYAALAQLIPAAAIIRVPARWIIPALFALAGLSAFGYAAIKRSTFNVQRLALILVTALLLIESLSIPLPLAAVENRATLNPAYYWLAQQPNPTQLALVELPLHSAPAPEYPEVKRLYAGTLGWWRLVNGYSGYTPPRQPQLAQALATFPDEIAISALQAVSRQPSAVSFLLVHPGEAPFDRGGWENIGRWQAEANPALKPIGQFEGDYLYRVLPPDESRFTGPPLAQFDRNIRLLDARLEPPNLLLYWQANAAPGDDYTVFVHLRAADGFVRSQADGSPVSGRLPTGHWLPGQVIQDIHPLPPGEDLSQVDHLAIGLYNPTTGQRLPATGPDGHPLADHAVLISVP